VKPALIASLLLLASCDRGGTPDIQISDAWARETVAGQTGTAAYLTITNRGTADDRLMGISATSPIAATIHETITSNGISSMRPVDDGLQIPAGGSASLRPGGTHVMVSGLMAALREGDTLKLTLRFDRSGDKPVDFKVASAINEMSH